MDRFFRLFKSLDCRFGWRGRFSLAAMFFLMLFAAIFFASIRALDVHYQRQLVAARKVSAVGVPDWSEAPLSRLGELCGCGSWHRITSIHYFDVDPNSEPSESDCRAGMDAIRYLPDLRRIEIHDPPLWQDPAGLAWLRNAPQLEELSVFYYFRPEDAVVLRELPRLTHLELWCVDLQGEDFRQLAELRQLEHLELHSCRISGLEYLAALPQLRSLELRGPEFDDEEILPAAKFVHLRKLQFDYSDCTDAALLQFAQLRQLELIDVTATNVSAEGIAAFSKAHPTCRVTTQDFD